MSERIVKADTNGRLYIQFDNRKWYAPGGTQARTGETVAQWRSYSKGPGGPEARQVCPPYNAPNRWPHELWTTTQPENPKRKAGVAEFKTNIGGAYVTVAARTAPGGPKRLAANAAVKAELYISVNGGLNFSWDAWDEFVDKVDALRTSARKVKRQTEEEIFAEIERIRQQYLGANSG